MIIAIYNCDLCKDLLTHGLKPDNLFDNGYALQYHAPENNAPKGYLVGASDPMHAPIHLCATCILDIVNFAKRTGNFGV